jgi:hypothetical protein
MKARKKKKKKKEVRYYAASTMLFSRNFIRIWQATNSAAPFAGSAEAASMISAPRKTRQENQQFTT